MNLFNIFNAPLKGVNLIEASAGTGKTYAIEGLYIRLLLEKKLTLDQILVVTFTRAATEELKSRIRQKLTLAKAALGGTVAQDPFIRDLCARTENHSDASQRLQNAILNFDQSAIYTIHGFCQRILAESAFETCNLFDFEVTADLSGLLYEIVDDFWRTYFYQAPIEFVSHAIKQLSSSEYFYGLSAKAARHNLHVLPYPDRPALKAIQDYRALAHELSKAWKADKQALLNLLKDPSLNGTIYGSLKPDANYPGLSKRDVAALRLEKSMDRFVAEMCPKFPTFKKFELFTRTKLMQSVNKNHEPPRHPFFDLCDTLHKKASLLEAEMNNFLIYMKSEFFKYVEAALSHKKKQANQIGFDDLLLMVKQALDHQGGTDLSTRIQQIYKAALVDEFQDTDAIQYEIFSRLFGQGESTWFMIGDPKQAIYSFRGADIFSYMEASVHADTPYTLLKNYRSDPPLLNAVNAIFSSRRDPFFFHGIGFEKAESGKTEGFAEQPKSAGLVLWHLFSDPPDIKNQPVSKLYAMRRVSQAVAWEINKLVSDGKNGIEFGDIAILVRTNRQAKLIKDHLSNQNIPCVLYQTGNVFKTDEAREMQRFLWGIAESGDERRIAAALSTDLMGISGNEFDAVQSSMTVDGKIASLKKYGALWQNEGFIRMFRRMMTEEKVKQRVMKFPDGERRLTNLLHLSEILHQKEIESSIGMPGLVKWLAKESASFSFDAEEHLVRLENDARAVNILTLHKSKGLEFPIVFYPFPWHESRANEKEVEFHDPSQNNRPAIDLGSEKFEEHKKLAENELLAENLRLFYVSLTRAKKKCYMAWGRIKGTETSAPAYLFHCTDHGEDPLTDLTKLFSEKDDDDLLDDLRELSERSVGAISVCALPSDENGDFRCNEENKKTLLLREFSGAVSNTFRVASYSSLNTVKIPANDVLDKYPDTGVLLLDESVGVDYRSLPAGQNLSDISRFPKGTRAGLFFHSIFENIAFDSFLKHPDMYPIVKDLLAYGFDPAWKGAVIKMIANVISTPLSTPEGDIRLCFVPRENRLNEMEFYFPIKKISRETLVMLFKPNIFKKVFENYPQHLEKLTFSPLEGFMKGFIDMVFMHKNRFYIVDWKSNFLGPTRAHYHQQNIVKIMRDHHYILQYHLYALALHCYLRNRMPSYAYQKHFGGIFYLFIRGMEPESKNSSGIYFDQPSEQFIETMSESLMPEITV